MVTKIVKQVNVERITKDKPLKKVYAKPRFDNLNESLHFQKNMNTVEERVLSILTHDKYARKKDWWLMTLYWAKMGYIKLIIPESEINKITPPETITRVRRKIMKEAKDGKPDLKFLLNDQENLDIKESHSQLYKEYFRK